MKIATFCDLYARNDSTILLRLPRSLWSPAMAILKKKGGLARFSIRKKVPVPLFLYDRTQ